MVWFFGIGPPFVKWSASIPLDGVPPLAGSCPLCRETALATVTTSPISQESVFSFPFFFRKILCCFSMSMFFLLDTAGYASS